MSSPRQRNASRSSQRLAGLILSLVFAFAVASPAAADTVQGSIGPDVTVITIGSTMNYGAAGGIRGYSVGTTSCNSGDAPIWWCNDVGDTFCEINQHPVIAQNLYRLKDGRFEQIGMSWLKHGFASTNSPNAACGSCTGPPHGGDQLGVGCTDTYGAGLNGSRPLGLRSEVHPTTGAFPYPYTSVGTSTVVDQRLRVSEVDVDPAFNAGALYWVEGHYVTEDDALAGNGLNNASYRRIVITGGASHNLSLQDATVRDQPAIAAWQAVDPAVEMLNVDVPGSSPVQRFHVARRVTDLGGGIWHYEYAVHNMNADRSGRSLEIDWTGPTEITNVGFHDVDHHSGEPYDTTDWEIAVDSGTGTVAWSTDPFLVDENANALRWGTMFTFWFDADRAPPGMRHTLGLFKSGSPETVAFSFPNDVAILFADGFESGNTTAWSSTVP